MRIAVVGAGLYGCVAAVDLARDGHEVTLHDKQPEIMLGASRANQGRVHRGYHYPRSWPTAEEAIAASGAFVDRFASSFRQVESAHWYGIAPDGKTTWAEYRDFLRSAGLARRDHGLQQWATGLDGMVRSDELLVDLEHLRWALYRELAQAHVALELGRPWPVGLEADRVVVCTYGRGWPSPLQWEVVEVCLFQATSELAGRGLVVLDGDFCSIDPRPDGRHMLYDVDVSVHHRHVGCEPEVPVNMTALIDAGEVSWAGSRWREILARAARFVPSLHAARYDSSMFTLRAVLPSSEGTDARPWRLDGDERIVHVLPGKLASCLRASKLVVETCRR